MVGTENVIQRRFIIDHNYCSQFSPPNQNEVKSNRKHSYNKTRPASFFGLSRKTRDGLLLVFGLIADTS